MFSLYQLVLIISITYSNAELKVNDVQNNGIVTFLDILNFYEKHAFMYYVDEVNPIDNFDVILKYSHDNLKQSIIVQCRKNHTINFDHLKAIPLVHMILLKNPADLRHSLAVSSCLTADDVVIFMIKQENWVESKFWTMDKLDWAGNVFIANQTRDYISIYNVCYYCENPMELNHLSTNSLTAKYNVRLEELLPRKFNDFGGYRFKVGYIRSFPYMHCMRKDESRNVCEEATGLENSMLMQLSEELNFTYSLTEINLLSDNGIEENKLDFVIGGVTMTSTRTINMFFTTSTAFQQYTFLYRPTKASWKEIFDNFQPFGALVWISVALSLCLFSLSLYMALNIIGKSSNISLGTCFRICLKSMLQQVNELNYKQFGSKFSPYVILILMWFSLLIITTAYRSKLWAISTQNTNVEPSNMKQLLNNNYRIIVNSLSRDVIGDVLEGNDPLIEQAKRDLVIKAGICANIDYALKNKAAVLDLQSVIEYHALIHCEEMKNVYSDLRITRSSFRDATHSWALKFGAPYKESFDNVVGKIHIAGLKYKWNTDTFRVVKYNYSPIPYSKSVLFLGNSTKVLQGFISAFVLYIIGNLCAAICFGLECYYNKKYVSTRYRD